MCDINFYSADWVHYHNAQTQVTSYLVTCQSTGFLEKVTLKICVLKLQLKANMRLYDMSSLS